MSGPRTIAIIGAGQAGGWAAKTLRDEGFAGHIALLGDEAHPPYERPPLSKAALLGAWPVEKCYLWPAESWREWDVDLRLRCHALRILRDRRLVEVEDGEPVAYDRLLIATGTRPRPLTAPGAELDGVLYLRYIPDMLAIRAHMDAGGRALVVGGGWIGLEVAAALRTLGHAVTVVEAADRLCGRAVTPAISDWLLALHRARGVDVRLGCSLNRFEGAQRLERAVLDDGSTIDVSLAVIGIGIVPNVEIAAEAGLAVDNGIVVDELCRTSDPDIFAAGDVTNHPSPLLGRRLRLESWENAQNQAIAAAKSMLDRGSPYAEVPWFWSDQYDANLQIAGIPLDWDAEVTRGDPAAGPFITFYLKGGRMEGAVAVDQGRELRFARRLIRMGRDVSPAALADPAVKLQALLKG
jgi:3-phenylpropionate/trans-cinnamate dioxygenase ferredoxin reductase subunit